MLCFSILSQAVPLFSCKPYHGQGAGQPQPSVAGLASIPSRPKRTPGRRLASANPASCSSEGWLRQCASECIWARTVRFTSSRVQALGPLGAVWALAAILQTSRKAAREGVGDVESGAASGMYLLSDSDDDDLEGIVADDEG